MLTAPLSVAALAVLVRVAVWRGADPWLRLTALATLVQQGVGLLYLTAGRYHYLAWLMTCCWWQRGWSARDFPCCAGGSRFSSRVAHHLRLERALARMSGDVKTTQNMRGAAP